VRVRSQKLEVRRWILGLWLLVLPCFAATNSTLQEEPLVLQPPAPEIMPTMWEQYGVFVIVLGIVFVTLVALGLWLLLRPKPPVVVPIEIQTRNELELLRLPTEDGKTVSRVSQVLKHYFAVAFELLPGEMTTAEFSRAVAGSDKVGSILAASVGDFLQQCDEQKFSPAGGVQTSACSRALELFQAGETRRTELRQVAEPR